MTQRTSTPTAERELPGLDQELPGAFVASAQAVFRGPAANLPATAVGYCVRRSDKPWGLKVCVVRRSGTETRRVPLPQRPSALWAWGVANVVLLGCSPRPSFLIPAPGSQPGPWDEVIDAWNQHLTARVGESKAKALINGIGARRAEEASRRLASDPSCPLQITFPGSQPPPGRAAVAATLYELDGRQHITGAIVWSDGTVSLRPLTTDGAPLTHYEALVQLTHRALRLSGTWAMPRPVVLLSEQRLIADLHAIMNVGEAPAVVTAIQKVRRTGALAALAIQLQRRGLHPRPPACDGEITLMAHATAAARAAALYAPADLAADADVWKRLTRGPQILSSSITRTTAKRLGAGTARLRGSSETASAFHPDLAQREAMKVLSSAEAQGRSLTGRPVVAVDGSLHKQYASCAVVLPDRTVTADVTGVCQADGDNDGPELLALLLGLALAPPKAIVYSDSMHAFDAWHTNDWTYLPDTPAVTELITLARTRTDCHVVWRRRRSTPGLQQADNAAKVAVDLISRAVPAIEALIDPFRRQQP